MSKVSQSNDHHSKFVGPVPVSAGIKKRSSKEAQAPTEDLNKKIKELDELNTKLAASLLCGLAQARNENEELKTKLFQKQNETQNATEIAQSNTELQALVERYYNLNAQLIKKSDDQKKMITDLEAEKEALKQDSLQKQQELQGTKKLLQEANENYKNECRRSSALAKTSSELEQKKKQLQQELDLHRQRQQQQHQQQQANSKQEHQPTTSSTDTNPPAANDLEPVSVSTTDSSTIVTKPTTSTVVKPVSSAATVVPKTSTTKSAGSKNRRQTPATSTAPVATGSNSHTQSLTSSSPLPSVFSCTWAERMMWVGLCILIIIIHLLIGDLTVETGTATNRMAVI